MKRICPSLSASAGNIDTPCNREDCGEGECKGPRVEGIGEEVLKIPIVRLRELGKLPADVEIVQILPDPAMRSAPGWYVGSDPHDPPRTYVHIRHRFCMRVFPGNHLCIGDLEGFLERYYELMKQGR